MKKFVYLMLAAVMLLSLMASAETSVNPAAENIPQDLSKLYQKFCDLAEEKEFSMQSQGTFTPDAKDGALAEKIALSSATTMTLFFDEAKTLIALEISTGVGGGEMQAIQDMSVLYPMLTSVVLQNAEIAESVDGVAVFGEILSAWIDSGNVQKAYDRRFGDYVVRVMMKDPLYTTDIAIQVRLAHEQAEDGKDAAEIHKALCAVVKQWLEVCDATHEKVHYCKPEENGFRIGVGECSYLLIVHDEKYMINSLVYVTPHTAGVLADPNVFSEGEPMEKLIGVLGANDDEQTDFFLKWMRKYDKTNEEMYECQFGEYKVKLYNNASVFKYTYVEITW